MNKSDKWGTRGGGDEVYVHICIHTYVHVRICTTHIWYLNVYIHKFDRTYTLAHT